MFSSEQRTACEQDPDLWFSGAQSNIAQAKKLCLECPVLDSCLERTLETEDDLGHVMEGVHAATTPTERTRIHLKQPA